MTVITQVEKLVVPLGQYTQAVLEEGDDDQESADHRHVSGQAVSSALLRPSGPRPHVLDVTYGFTGSARVSSISSSLLVCCLIASKALPS